MSANVPESRPKKEAIAKQSGDRVRLHDGRIAEVVTNPLDGVWLIVRAVDEAGATEEMVLLTDIAGPA